MRKLFDISVVAMFAAMPMVVNAAATKVPLVNNGNTPEKSQVVSSTSYVQGAYNKLGKQINNIIDDSTVPQAATGTSYNAISSNKNVAENLVALDAAIATATGELNDTYVTKDSAQAKVDTTGNASGLQYISAGDGKVGENLGILDNQVYKYATKIGEFNESGNANYVSKDNAIQQNIQILDGRVKSNANTIGAYDPTKSHAVINNTNTVFDNLHALDYQVSANSLSINQNTAAIGTVTDLSAIGGATNLVDAIVNVNNSLGSASQLNVANGNYIGANHDVTTVSGALTALDNQAKTNADNIAEMHAKKMNMATTWGSNTTVQQVPIFE